MKKMIICGLSLLIGVSLVACGSTETNKEKVKITTESAVEKSSSSDKKPKEEKKSSLGKRSNPVPFGQTGTFQSWSADDEANIVMMDISITLSDITRGEQAFSKLNEYSEPAPEGMEWVVINVKGDVLTSEDPDVNYNFYNDFAVFDSTGKSVNQVLYTTPVNHFNGEAYEGASIEGNIAIIAPINDNFLLEYQAGNTKVYFATQ